MTIQVIFNWKTWTRNTAVRWWRGIHRPINAHTHQGQGCFWLAATRSFKLHKSITISDMPKQLGNVATSSSQRTTPQASMHSIDHGVVHLETDIAHNFLSVSGRCCLDGSSIHQPIFCCSSTLQTLAPIQSSTSFSQDLFGLPLFLCPFTFPSGNNFSSVCCIFICPK